MAVLTRLAFIAASAAAATGCTLYFEEDEPGDPGGGGGGSGGQGGGANRLSLPCLHEIAGGDVQPTVEDTLLAFYACEGGAIVSSIYFDAGIREFQPRRDWNDAYRDAKVVDLDGAPPYEMVSTTEGNDLGVAVWSFGAPPGWVGWARMDLMRQYEDIAAYDVVGPESRWAIAGENALRILEFDNPQREDRNVLTGRNYLRVVAVPLDTQPANDLFYIARGESGGLILGAAHAVDTSATMFDEQVLFESTTPGEPGELLAADLDQDGIDDVIGAMPELFVRSSRFGRLDFVGTRASQIATGDLDGDGVTEIVFLTEDRDAVHRVDVSVGAAELTFVARPWQAQGGDRLAVADLDGDTHDDLVLLRGRGQPSSELAFIRSP